MSILHYFSKDSNKRAKFMFNAIASVYAKMDGGLMKSYEKSIDLVKEEIDLENKLVLDIGTGTGAWAAMFMKNNASAVHGVDIATKMLKESKRKHPEIEFSIGNAEKLDQIKDNSYDIVTASYVVHGVKADRRAKIIAEMRRISKKHIIIHDFVGRTALFVRFLEFVEKSDYKNFKKNFCDELKTIFSNTKRIDAGDGSGLYIAKK